MGQRFWAMAISRIGLVERQHPDTTPCPAFPDAMTGLALQVGLDGALPGAWLVCTHQKLHHLGPLPGLRRPALCTAGTMRGWQGGDLHLHHSGWGCVNTHLLQAPCLREVANSHYPGGGGGALSGNNWVE